MAQTGDDSKDEQSANQIQQFEEMQNNIKSMIDGIGDIDKDKKANVESIISEINTVCDQMQTFVESLRKDLLQQVLSVTIFGFYIFTSLMFSIDI